MDEFDVSLIANRPVFCTYCGDHQVIPSLARQPCPKCCPEDYREWKEARERARVQEAEQGPRDPGEM